ncbi:MAG: lipoyl(octanoyl) transferase LipB, partial [Thermoplasmata archaeon]|nr:lipoyl(octanoyl) transferase LipB [Thermoplasmata archaeon]
MLEVREWGVRPYPESLAEMRALRAARRRGEIPDTLLLVEHPAVITVGVQGAELESLPAGIPVVQVERGGHSTYHGPGQLVGYPIVDLDARGRNVRGFVGSLETLIVAALAELGLPAGTVAGQRGVWVDGERKIASVGIAVEEWVSFHGFALNVDPDLSVFAAFQPCGLDGRRMTSVARELGHPVSVEELRLPVRRAFLREFGERASPLAEPGPPPT